MLMTVSEALKTSEADLKLLTNQMVDNKAAKGRLNYHWIQISVAG